MFRVSLVLVTSFSLLAFSKLTVTGSPESSQEACVHECDASVCMAGDHLIRVWPDGNTTDEIHICEPDGSQDNCEYWSQ